VSEASDLNRLLGHSMLCRPQGGDTTRCWICGQHTRAGLPVEAPSDDGKRMQMNLLPRNVFELFGANAPGRIRVATANLQADKANCYSNA